MTFFLFFILLNSPMTNQPPNPTYAPKDSQSIIDKESRIQANTDEVKRRQASIDRWNKWYIGFLAITFVAGGGSLFTTKIILRKEARKNSLEGVISGDKDEVAELRRRSFIIDSKAKDVEIGKAKVLAADATKAAEHEKLEREKLELLVSPRRLTPDQQKRIGDACLAMYGKRVAVSSYGMDPEGKVLAVQIAFALSNSNILVSFDPGGPVTSAGLDTGVDIRGPEEESRFTGCLAHALMDIGKLKDVRVNGARHEGTTMHGLVSLNGGVVMSGGSSIRPAAPLPPGSPVEVFVGIRPIEIPVIGK